LYSQPEKTRWKTSCGLRTSTCTNAPVSVCASQGAVVSQARRRTITSPTLNAWPGFIVRSREMPLRLFSSPMTATRSAIGVVPGATVVTVCGISTVIGSGSESRCTAGGAVERLQPATSSRPTSKASRRKVGPVFRK